MTTAVPLPIADPITDGLPVQTVTVTPADVTPNDYAEDVIGALSTLLDPMLAELDGRAADRDAHQDAAGADAMAKRAAWVRTTQEQVVKAVRAAARTLADDDVFHTTGRPVPPRRRGFRRR